MTYKSGTGIPVDLHMLLDYSIHHSQSLALLDKAVGCWNQTTFGEAQIHFFGYRTKDVSRERNSLRNENQFVGYSGTVFK